MEHCRHTVHKERRRREQCEITLRAVQRSNGPTGSDRDNVLHLLQKLPNSPIVQALKRCFWHRKGRFEAVLILTRCSRNTIVPPCWFENGNSAHLLFRSEDCSRILVLCVSCPIWNPFLGYFQSSRLEALPVRRGGRRECFFMQSRGRCSIR
jgi:hypothetical protein